jgi:site-specific recombinase XerD
VRFRLRDGANVDLYVSSGIEVNPEQWDNNKECIKAKVLVSPALRNEVDTAVRDYKNVVSAAYKKLVEKNEIISSQNLLQWIDKVQHPEKYLSARGEEMECAKPSFFALYDKFINETRCSTKRKENFILIKHHLEKFVKYMQKTNRTFELDIDKLSVETLNSFETFLFEEKNIYGRYPEIWFGCRKPRLKGQNSVNALMDTLRRFNNWALNNEHTTNYPFKKFEFKPQIYGTPYFLTLEERNQLYNFPIKKEKYAVQRDIFVFQCCIGCRVGDLLRFTKQNIINGAIEYIAAKTREGHPRTVRVPLNEIAKDIIKRYENEQTGNRLLPFTDYANYNYAIGKVCKEAGLNRIISVLNTQTRQAEQHPLYEIATSHIARRTFIGNLYKKVRDPNLIASMSGHIEGSKAFNRYRTIDEDIKKDLVKMLE